jgi:hypothetical protein
MNDTPSFLIKMILDKIAPEPVQVPATTKTLTIPASCIHAQKDYKTCMLYYNHYLCSKEFEQFIKCTTDF